ncbi:MAG TPA: hypothetical protein VJJ98_13520 [Sedimentisphaerales bacterium]|nr:hypothetical protein [Sedimentisphaerales bacterium]
MNWLSTLGPSLLMVIGGIITWLIKSRIEELRATEERLTEARRKTYSEILDPYITLFADIRGEGQKKAIKTITSRDYRKAAFELSLFGSDEVVRAYNALMRCAHETETAAQPDPKVMITRWGALLLEIRKSLGNKNTSSNTSVTS